MVTLRNATPPSSATSKPRESARRLLGRPKDPEKRRAIIAAGQRMFFDHGYEAVAMEAVAAAAGVSKMTVYSHFQDKAALFGACVHAACAEMLAGLTGLDHQAVSGDLKEALVAFGSTFLKFVFSPRAIVNLPRLVLSLRQDPVLARTFYEAGPERTRASLARIIEAAAERGELVLDAPMDAADDLMSLWKGHADNRVLMGIEPPLSEAALERRARRGTEVFLRAYRP
jgi:TetR/AcrR family transcriptional regulator, mexJK operon transcriptional repressor